MKKAFIIFSILAASLLAKENIIDQEILERYKKLCTRIEWVIKSEHEYYMMDDPNSYSMQVIRNVNNELYEILFSPPVYEEVVLGAGQSVLREVKKSQLKKVYMLPEKEAKSRVTYYSFSSIN